MAGDMAGILQLSNPDQSVGQDGQAEHMIARNFSQHATEQVLFDSSSLQVSASPAYQAAIRDVLARIQATGRVLQIHSTARPGLRQPGLREPARRAAAVRGHRQHQ